MSYTEKVRYAARLRFADLQDGNRIYEAGDTYPRPGLDIPEARIAELAGSDNAMGYPLIQAVEQPVEPVQTEPKETVEQEPKPAQKRRRSRQRG